MMRFIPHLNTTSACVLVASICWGGVGHTAAQGTFSRLWGERGESWATRLPDFSYAGYYHGEKPLPVIEVRGISVREFGAVGDGQADDTEAFEKALAAVTKGIIEVPPGRYVITKPLRIAHAGVVLRGASPAESVLVFPKPLNDIVPNWGETTSGRRTSNYSWSGGFVTIAGDLRTNPLTAITQPARRGDNILVVASTEKLNVGQWVEIFQQDTPENKLAARLYSGNPGGIKNLEGRARTAQVCRIERIEPTNRIVLNRPLRSDIEQEWKPMVRSFAPSVTDSGIENLRFEFPDVPYKGHFTELGYNAIALRGTAHCWVRNIQILNADSGIFVSGVYNTLAGISLASARKPDAQGNAGHHGISVGGGDNLVTAFEFRVKYIHDLTVTAFTSGNVFSRGRAVDLSLDHHRRAPFENLFTQLDAGLGSRVWSSGGGADLGKHCGAHGTFWNIRASRSIPPPPDTFGPPSMNIVGLSTSHEPITEPDGKWFEVIPPEQLHPQNLHEAQLLRRRELERLRDVK